MSIELLLGTYTRRTSEGVYRIELNTETQKLENLSLIASIENPTYLTMNKDASIIYTIISEGDQGGLASLVKQEDGSYKKQAVVLAEGAAPCYVSYDANRQLVYTANYHKGEVAVYKTDDIGQLLLVDTATHEGSSDHENQDAPHAHYMHLTPDEKYCIACDLGTDKVYTYDVSEEGKLTEVTHLTVAPGSGPRHLVFHPTLNIAYLFAELSSEVIVLSYDPETGKFEVEQTISTIPSDHDSFNSGAAIRISSDGNHLYASNRGHNSIARYEVARNGQLVFADYTPTEGETPRDFNLTPDEKYVVVGHQDEDYLTLFERDTETGELTLLQKEVTGPEVVCVAHG